MCVILKSSYTFLLNGREVILYSLLVLMGKVHNIFNIYFIAVKMKITFVFCWGICDCIFCVCVFDIEMMMMLANGSFPTKWETQVWIVQRGSTLNKNQHFRCLSYITGLLARTLTHSELLIWCRRWLIWKSTSSISDQFKTFQHVAFHPILCHFRI